MSEKSKKNQTIQYYDQNAAYFVENTRDVDFHVIQDEFLENFLQELRYWIWAAVPDGIPNIFWNMDIRSMPSTAPQSYAHWQQNTQVFR